ncbi:MAG: hypothetical protein ACRYE9_02610 [Janthinobacterium lividum]
MNKNYFVIALLAIITSACQNSDQIRTSNREISSLGLESSTINSTMPDVSRHTGNQASTVDATVQSVPLQ